MKLSCCMLPSIAFGLAVSGSLLAESAPQPPSAPPAGPAAKREDPTLANLWRLYRGEERKSRVLTLQKNRMPGARIPLYEIEMRLLLPEGATDRERKRLLLGEFQAILREFRLTGDFSLQFAALDAERRPVFQARVQKAELVGIDLEAKEQESLPESLAAQGATVSWADGWKNP